uniref:uncharacterized protein LOC122610598 n=1 Tax=Erigeron canadensis TaxID=72917 RepID=UPI001CB9A14D|nr:uncharacterized protein LOC122610598 [Erigeron canadensis]
MFAEAEILDSVRRFRLEYHWLPPRCSHCKIFGHKLEDCSVRPRTQKEMEARMATVAPTSHVGPSGTKDGPSGAKQVDPPEAQRPLQINTANTTVPDIHSGTQATTDHDFILTPPAPGVETSNQYDAITQINTDEVSTPSVELIVHAIDDFEDESDSDEVESIEGYTDPFM